ncbi:MAG: excinuclease ABC subunit A [SAR324 cluster bacterium]|uniref:UvrABC system protein A n=1 Tax=SAR324 cluster bacterium TaxID=2024889 RepID=A0A2A4T8Z5_9DELT|nr:MAG: excinuclease ABC subunit A [SAR324 cluster bacterium]
MVKNPDDSFNLSLAQHISIRQASEHNLKQIDIDIPRNKFVVITGLSGSGKSSLAFDTIYAEGQRRYVESLSAYARQFLDQMQKPAVESITGLTPTISIEQRTGKSTPRSTVATATEIYDYLRILFARAGTPFCPHCDQTIVSQSAEDIVNYLLTYAAGTRLHLLAPLVRGKKGEHREVLDFVRREGFTRLRIDGEMQLGEEVKPLKKTFKHDIEAVVDRVVIREDVATRLTDSVEVALKLSEGTLVALLENRETGEKTEERFSEKFACPEHGPVLEEVSPRIFSFNSPFGSCSACSGLGTLMEPAAELIIPDPNLSLEDGAIKAWKRCGSGLRGFYNKSVHLLANLFEISIKTPWNKIPEATRHQILYGSGKNAVYEGLIPNLQRRFQTTDSEGQKAKIHEFMTSLPCTSCHGKRLRPEVLSIRIEGKNIHDITQMTVEQSYRFFKELELDKEKQKIADPIKKAVLERLGFLQNVGLSYLNLNRTTNTLSGGEAQRIRLGSQVGAKLVGVTYVLDEPTIGLHQRDNERLLNTLVQLKNLGNTVIVVEHDEEVIRRADYLIDIGPGAGKHGGEIVAKGTPKEVLQTNSLTAQYLNGTRKIEIPEKRRPVDLSKSISITGAEANNLKKINVSFPLGTMICVTGVSGSGKSTLVNECLLKAIQKELGSGKVIPGKYKSIKGIDQIDKIINIDQSPIGRTSRSNPATYTGLFDGIRKIFTALPEAKIRGYTPGRFSFNVKGGRCEACQGQGVKVIEMHFLPDVHVLCETCKGSRYNRETLQVKYRGKSVADILAMPVDEACEFFKNHKKIYPALKTLLDVGLDYIQLGQPSPTLSGGEAQRIKLASELSKRSTGKTFYILDEPTTGLHFHDIARLMEVLHRLVDLGNTAVIIEHNLDVIKCADWLLDLGPEGGELGGNLVAAGTPEKIAKTKNSHTGKYLKQLLFNGDS